jgi:hypothetical protein
VLHQARVLSWGKEKRYYYERKPSFESQARQLHFARDEKIIDKISY